MGSKVHARFIVIVRGELGFHYCRVHAHNALAGVLGRKIRYAIFPVVHVFNQSAFVKSP